MHFTFWWCLQKTKIFNDLLVLYHYELYVTFEIPIFFWFLQRLKYNTIHMYSGITSGRVLNGKLLYTKILEVNLFAFAYRLFHRDFSPINGTFCMGTHSFLQLYMYFMLIWEGFMNAESIFLVLICNLDFLIIGIITYYYLLLGNQD